MQSCHESAVTTQSEETQRRCFIAPTCSIASRGFNGHSSGESSGLLLSFAAQVKCDI